MGKALVLSNVNFSTNKLTTVSFGDSIPCTAIALSESMKAMTSIGSTFTLLATLTPVNTTDTPTWSTNNSAVATVNNGVVTQTGIGSATITVTCGSQTTTCVITATNVLDFSYELESICCKRADSGGNINDYGQVTSSGGGVRYCAIYNDTVETQFRIGNYGTTQGYKYPIPLGNGATTVTADVPAWVRITVWWLDSNTVCDIGKTNVSLEHFAKLLSGDASAYDSNVAIGDRVMTVPDGANSAIFSLHVHSSTGHSSVTAEDVAAVTLTVS